MRITILITILIMFLAGCTANESPSGDAPNDVNLNAAAILARQTSDAAMARSAALSAQATAARQATMDTQNRSATEAAIRLEFLRVTETAQAQLVEGANLQKTEVARFEATRTAEAKTATAVAKMDAQRAAEGTATMAAIQTSTRRAEANETATATAAVPTRVFIAQQVEDDRAARERQRMLELERYRQDVTMAPIVRTVELFMPSCLALVIVLAFGAALILIAVAAKNWIDARTLNAGADILGKVHLITDPYGNTVGYLAPVGGAVKFQRIEQPLYEPEELEVNPAPAALVRRDSTEAPKAVKEIAPPTEPIVGELIYVTDLKVFTATILETGDWTQRTWGGKVLPRGFVLSMDTVDEQGRTVYGGYSQLLQMFVDSRLIIGRGPKSTGKWNPNAPIALEAVMAILERRAHLPPLPPEAPKKEPLTSPTKRRARKIAPSV